MFEVIRQEWKQRAPDLAEWAMRRLVNRKDVWGQYSKLSERERESSTKTYKALTLPVKSKRGSDMVSLDKLTRHFSGLRRHHLIGLHSSSEENTSRWLAIDIDMHDIGSAQAEDLARRNKAAAVAWWDRLQAQGYDPVLIDSNGCGGFHLWLFFAEPVSTPVVYAFGQEIISDWQQRNLDRAPETYPRQAERTGDLLGAWLRLPGLHHTLDQFSRVWSGEPWLDEPWLEGEAAIDLLLANPGGPPPPNPAEL